MDKYEFNIKVEQIKKLVNKGDFETAMKIADTIDWRRVRSANLLSMVAQVYEHNNEYQEAKEVLLLAFERAPIGKRLLYKLAELALKEGSIAEAEDYYREFCDLAPDDSRQHLLRYMILKAKKAPAEQLIHSLERYTSTELDEKWLYELAELYQQAGKTAECVAICDKIMLMFGLGKYVDKAMELKIQYEPLTSYQMDLVENRDKYEAKLNAVKQEYGSAAEEYMEEPIQEPALGPELKREVFSEPEVQKSEEELVASIHEAEAEERLAEELSKFSIEDYVEEEDSLGQTKILDDISQITSGVQDIEENTEAEVAVAAIQEHIQENSEEEKEEVIDELLPVTNHLMIEARVPEKGLEMAIESLKKIHRETGSKNPVAKITGSKLNEKGIINIADKLVGKDVVIEEAGDLSGETLEELRALIKEDVTGMVVVLIDNPRQMENLHEQNPEFARIFECIGVQESVEGDIDESSSLRSTESIEKAISMRTDAEVEIAKEVEQAKLEKVQDNPVTSNRKSATSKQKPMVNPDEEMDLDEFAEYACDYASEIDCSISGKSMLALYERIEIMEEDGIRLTRANAEELIEEAADKAEKPSLGRMITGVFSSKYDKEGLLILKEEHFIG